MRSLLPLLLCASCAASSSTSSSSSSGSVGLVDAAVIDTPDAGEQPCDVLPAGVTSGEALRDGGVMVPATRKLVIMGGGTEVDEAARAFVESAGGQDVLVLRATGSVDSYTAYFSSDLLPNPAPASVTTVRIDDPLTSSHPAILCRVQHAEALWFAGGDQWTYAGLWQPALHQALQSSSSRSAFGGTSAGAMLLSEFIFSAQHGSVTSEEALMAPAALASDVIHSPVAHPDLAGTLVDTHFTQRNREGRLLVFAAHALQQGAARVVGIGLDEETALVVEDGNFSVSGNGSMWIYVVTGPVVTLAGNQPLSLQGIVRTEFRPGSQGLWPLNAPAGTALEVQSGSVVTR